MKIIIDKNHYVEQDNDNYILYQKSILKKTRFTKEENIGKEKITLMGYYSTLEGAISKTIQLTLASNDAVVSLKEFIAKYKEIQDELKGVLI